MKPLTFLPGRISGMLLVLITFFSCRPEERPVPVEKWEISSARLVVQGKETILYTLPEEFQQETPVISALPSQASIAEIQKDASGKWALAYQSTEGKAGTDALTIDSENEENHPNECHSGTRPYAPFFGHKQQRDAPEKLHRRLKFEIVVKEVNLLKSNPSSGK
jgi:hypothetical protein